MDDKPCVHIKEAWKVLKELQVETYGCDCSGYIHCEKCDVEVDNTC